MVLSESVQLAVEYLLKGDIISYPTEAVFGLGCDPLNHKAVMQLLQLKGRPASKGLILIASNWEQMMPFIKTLSEKQYNEVNKTWPGPITWVFPASQETPEWLTTPDRTIAIRMTDHPVAKTLCEHFKNPIVSTSANPTGAHPAKTYQEVINYFGDNLAFIFKGETGSLDKPTMIKDVCSGKILRAP